MQVDLSRDAENDLIEIWTYTEAKWGESQADRYQYALFECAGRLSDGTASLRHVPGTKNFEAMNCREHVIFATRRPSGIVIVGILHQRMDLARRLAERLG